MVIITAIYTVQAIYAKIYIDNCNKYNIVCIHVGKLFICRDKLGSSYLTIEDMGMMGQ